MTPAVFFNADAAGRNADWPAEPDLATLAAVLRERASEILTFEVRLFGRDGMTVGFGNRSDAPCGIDKVADLLEAIEKADDSQVLDLATATSGLTMLATDVTTVRVTVVAG
ncbi:hypothetical protein ACIA5D_36580 [Actinoplanes sp. NPDC051513]|uniref:hypothetical protein n=1 Tax=Actinoplanes sp. NPDC051513 TaxID=3363908 RepID=UPI0037905B5F